MRSIRWLVMTSILSSGLGAYQTVEARSPQDFDQLAGKLAEAFPEVKQRGKSYLSNAIVIDPTTTSDPVLRNDVTASFSLQGGMYSTLRLPVRNRRGIPFQKDIILLQLKPGTSIDRVNALLDKYKLKVRSGVPEVGLLIVEVARNTPGIVAAVRDPEIEKPFAQIQGLKDTIRALREEEGVATAAANSVIGPTTLPPPTQGQGKDRSGNVHHWDWREGAGTPAAQGRDGNYGQKLVRFPAAWNFNDAIKARGKTDVHVGVLDVGFHNHEDLSFVNSSVTPPEINDHGNHVMGIIAATANNTTGTNGGTPFATITACSVRTNTLATPSSLPAIFPILSEVIASMVEFTSDEPDLKVVNVSLGYNWVPNLGRNPNIDTELQEFVESHGIIMRSLANLLADRNIILVSAAGNDSDAESGFPNVQAQWGSPFNWAAFHNGISDSPATNIVVVESINRTEAISPFSNVRGCLSAPGQAILSTVAHNELGEPVSDGYAVFNGTSMAAPQVTALIALMYAYNPDLTMNEVLDILNVRTANRPATVTPAPRIDAFDALVACRERSLKDLADLNGDDKVDMADFQIFRDALRQVEGAPGVVPKDLNGDGVIAPTPNAPTAPGENVSPRADLNGSGKLSRDSTDARQVKGESLTDLQIMMKVWEDPTTPATMLPGLL